MFRISMLLILMSIAWILVSAATSRADENSHQLSPVAVQQDWRYFAVAEESTGKLLVIVGSEYAQGERGGVPVPGAEVKDGQTVFEVTGSPALSAAMGNVDAYLADVQTSTIRERPDYVTPDMTPGVSGDASISLAHLIPAIIGVTVAAATVLDRWSIGKRLRSRIL